MSFLMKFAGELSAGLVLTFYLIGVLAEALKTAANLSAAIRPSRRLPWTQLFGLDMSWRL
jgi:hypothetical protein